MSGKRLLASVPLLAIERVLPSHSMMLGGVEAWGLPEDGNYSANRRPGTILMFIEDRLTDTFYWCI